ncbi:MAG: hypothetical protein P3T54_01250 [Dehalogenimonas sp.]|uniref:Uncharacterized protein n=1 Tax=Candidatus Dehalogenimonas loeffleri TaxID=3127115 RepID=A0ABZ2J631_9CHLR|nr:hypothetical protein [Dehalogenimonas sp.]
MKQLGFGLFIVAFIAMLGSFVWLMATEAEQTPWIVILVTGAFLLGTILLLAQAIVDRQKQKKKENFEEVDN